jgi:hypothetical protein
MYQTCPIVMQYKKESAMEIVTDTQRIKTHQMGILELFGEGWKYYRANFVKILIIILFIYIPINTIVLLIPVHESLLDDPVRLMQLYGRIYQFFEAWVGCIATVGIAAIVEGTILGANLSWGDAMRKGFSRWGSAVGTSILAGLILLGLTLLLIVPGIIWAVYYMFWLYIVALRNIGGKTALDYSKNLVTGQWWRVLGIIIVITLADLITGLIVNIPLWFLPDNLIVNVLSNTTLDAISSLFTVISIVFFLNTDYLKNNLQSQNQSVDLGNNAA